MEENPLTLIRYVWPAVAGITAPFCAPGNPFGPVVPGVLL
ncbi:MAG: hypothetical protein BWY67_01816 [Bacteroidetes bacterium ADurb.Bin397]|nr:MAG: hypothetical protein BWY67_01816 [Bacteroidetes bacterium ADurb.Bin397]